MGIRGFEDLDVYQRAFETSLEIHKTTLEFPKIEQYALGDQIRRTSKSICANIAEGFGRQKSSNAAYNRFLIMALGSGNEMFVWLDYCKRLDYISSEDHRKWREAY